jgi:RNA-binding protein YlmH
LLSNVYDKIKLSEKIPRSLYTNEFFSPNLWKSISQLEKKFDTKIYTYGVFEEAERRMLAFSKDEDIEFPVKILKIQNKSHFDKLEHRDYLGALMNLGVIREKFGDLILDEDSCYMAVCDDIADYIIYNLNNIGRCPCKIELLEKLPSDIKVKGEDFTIFVTSLRLDCVVGSICNLSRSKAVDIINSGKVLIDYSVSSEKNDDVQIGSTITIRGYGKFKVIDEIGSTQRGRVKLLMKKYT